MINPGMVGWRNEGEKEEERQTKRKRKEERKGARRVPLLICYFAYANK